MNAPSQLLECVPNFSAGSDRDILRAIEASFRSVRGAAIVDIHADAEHNRSVFTVVGEPLALQEATFEAVRTALARIDMRTHRGQHPRLGAADVIPFVSIPPTSKRLAIETARTFAEGLANALDLPVYLYDQATFGPTKRPLPAVRRGGFEWLRTALRQGTASLPDFGPHRIHPSGGATIVGARDYLVAFNVNLNTSDVEIATNIARAVRASSGGHAGIRALGLGIGGRAQVSMNLYDLRMVTVWKAYTLVDAAAAAHGVAVHSSEIVGLAPRAALAGASANKLKLPGKLEDYVLETRIERLMRR